MKFMRKNIMKQVKEEEIIRSIKEEQREFMMKQIYKDGNRMSFSEATSIQHIYGQKITTKGIVQNGNIVIEQYENDQLLKKSVIDDLLAKH